MRYPLVDGQGNFGNVDGDNPAAQRYTEARLTAAAAALMEGLAEDAVDFRDNYDGSEQEPVVLPAAFPNLLANGSSGIAVGMATNIPPHNIDELVRRLPAPDQGARTPGRDAARLRAGAGLPDRRDHHRAARRDQGGLSDGAGQLPAARALGGRGSRARPVADRRHRDPLPGAEGQADRADGGADQPQEGADPGGRARRERRGHPRRAGAAGADGRSGGADGDAVQGERSRDALRHEHERADRRAHAAGLDAEGGAAGVPRPPARGAAAARRGSGWRRSTRGWRCWKACSSPTSTSTG